MSVKNKSETAPVIKTSGASLFDRDSTAPLADFIRNRITRKTRRFRVVLGAATSLADSDPPLEQHGAYGDEDLVKLRYEWD